jgi:hypothetical protein
VPHARAARTPYAYRGTTGHAHSSRRRLHRLRKGSTNPDPIPNPNPTHNPNPLPLTPYPYPYPYYYYYYSSTTIYGKVATLAQLTCLLSTCAGVGLVSVNDVQVGSVTNPNPNPSPNPSPSPSPNPTALALAALALTRSSTVTCNSSAASRRCRCVRQDSSRDSTHQSARLCVVVRAAW